MYDKNEMMDALSKVMPAIASREIIVGSKCFVFNKENVIAYNDSICISAPITTGISCAVNAEDFYNIIKSVKGKDFDMSLDGKQISVTSKGMKADIAIDTAEQVNEMIEALSLDDLEFKELPENFIEAMSLLRFTASKEINSDNTQCLSIQGKFMFSTDSYRVSEYELDSEVENFLIPANKSLSSLIKQKAFQYSLTEGWVHFMSEDGTIFSSRVVTGEYPDLEEIMEEYRESKGFNVFPGADEVVEIAREIAFMCEEEQDEDKAIEVVVKGKEKKALITCRASKDRGKIEKKTSVEMKKPLKKSFKFNVNPYFLADILEKTAKISVMEDRAVFKMKNLTHLVSLMVEEED